MGQGAVLELSVYIEPQTGCSVSVIQGASASRAPCRIWVLYNNIIAPAEVRTDRMIPRIT